MRCLILGSGGGYTAAIAARANLERCFTRNYSRGAVDDHYRRGEFPGYPDGVTGPEMMIDFKSRRRFGATIPPGEPHGVLHRPLKVTIDNEKVIEADTMLSPRARRRNTGTAR